MKNLKIHNLKRKVASFILLTTMIGSVAMLSGCSKKVDIDTEEIISCIHTEGGIESDILRYIEISDKLNKLNLNQFILGEDITVELDTVENIQKHIDNFDGKNLYCLRYLKMQEELVNSYIYNIGYDTAYENSCEATKKYAGEFYGIEDYKNIIIGYNNPNEYNANNAPSEENVTIKLDKYSVTGFEVTNKYIFNGARAMANTDIDSDPDKTDNNLYNEDRNAEIKKAIIIAEYLDQQVENNDLYNEKAASKIKR